MVFENYGQRFRKRRAMFFAAMGNEIDVTRYACASWSDTPSSLRNPYP